MKTFPMRATKCKNYVRFLHFDTLHFVNDNCSVSYTFVNFKLTFIESKRQDMS